MTCAVSIKNSVYIYFLGRIILLIIIIQLTPFRQRENDNSVTHYAMVDPLHLIPLAASHGQIKYVFIAYL